MLGNLSCYKIADRWCNEVVLILHVFVNYLL